jgi:putative ABC transport system ATP-binding protein
MGDVVLQLTQVTKIYGQHEQAVRALDDASLSVRRGQVLAIVGPSGSGKTTLLAIAGTLLQPTSGQVSVDGTDLVGLAPARLARIRLERIGFVLQSSNLIPFLKARDQLLLVSELAGRRGPETARRAGELLDELGIATRAGHYPEALSGGERQRVAIARALMNDPSLILADEPTASLDTARGREVVELLVREAKSRDKALVMVTHDERMLDLCDDVVHIVDGRLQASPALDHAGAPLSPVAESSNS